MEKLIKKDEAAEMLSISIHTMNKWVALKKIPFLKIGGAVRFKTSQIERWVNRKMVKPELIEQIMESVYEG